MFQYKVYDGENVIGCASAEKIGLYWHIEADVRMGAEAVTRLYAHEQEKAFLLGVLIPEDGWMRLMKKIAASRMIFSEHTRIDTQPDSMQPIMPEEAAWEAFSGSIQDIALEGRIQRRSNGATLMIETAPGEECPLMPIFRFCRLEEQNGSLRWLLELDAEGNPVMPQEKKPLTSGENVLE